MSDQDQPQTELERHAAALRSYVTPEARTVVVSGTDGEFIKSCAAEALALVTQLLTFPAGDAGLGKPPAEVFDRAVVEAGAALYTRRSAPNGITQYADPTGTPVRLARDPLNVARVILAAWIPLGFA